MTNIVMPIQLRLGAFDVSRISEKANVTAVHAKTQTLTLKIVP
jgi:hypothetical protein